ncbi:MAG TPA: ABC transporter substrate-binding protein [Acidimicrobiia bacterium]|nr:ABC transporter substrate-binding protein [Acidimicrobiia bacterium]
MSPGRARCALVAVLAFAIAGCGSGVSNTSPSTTTPVTGHKVVDVPGLGTGVTDTEIKLGVVLVDFKCIEGAVDSIYVNQEQAYNAFIDDINEHGGVNGRKIVPVFKTVCPVPVDLALAACTSLTEDSHVFAVIGSMYDPAGDARQCIAKQHKTVLITDGVSQEMIAAAPPGLLLTGNITPDRRLKVIMALVKSRHILDGKKVGVLTEPNSTARVKSVVTPALDAIGVEQGAEAVLSISGLDTHQAQTELDSFIERWKTEHVNALILVGAAPSSKQFVTKVKAAIPDMQLISDTTDVIGGGQDSVKAHVVPNPYAGIITAEGRIGLEHSKTPHYTYCKKIFEKQTGIVIPLPNVVVKLPNGKQNDIYGNAENACSFVTMFATIAKRVGKNLNNANWISTVNNFGPIEVMNTDYASLHAGKYDADDTYGLVQFDPTIPPIGDWRHLTPTENVSGS